MKLNFCPECAAPLKKHNDTEYVCVNGHPYWNSPRATVSVILLKDKQALFAKRGLKPKKGKYDFPGGFTNYGEDPVTAMNRELDEETGLKADELLLIGCSGQTYQENVTLCDFIFVSHKWHGTIAANDDVAALEWKPIEFISSPQFAWDYGDLLQKLQALVRSPNTL